MLIPNLKRIVAGGAEIQGPLFAKVKAVLEPGAEMYSDYGATEALPVAEIAGDTVIDETWPLTIQGHGVCAGKPLDGVQIRIIRSEDGVIDRIDDAVEMATGQVGEIIVRSPHISEDYFKAPESTAENKIPEGDVPWHRIGDLGSIDEQGRLWLCGRKSHKVSTAFGDLYPLCCEPVFNAHPGVHRSALVGVNYGSRIVPTICVEPTRDSTPIPGLEAQLMDLAGAHSSTRLIERVVFMEHLPVDQRHNAKIDRPALAAALAAAWSESGVTRSVELDTPHLVTNMLK